MPRPLLVRALAIASLVAAPAAAQPHVTVSTFSEYASPVTTEHQATIGAPVSSGFVDAYALFPIGVARNVLGTWGQDAALDPIGAANLPSNLGGSTALYGTQFGEEIDIFLRGTNLITGQVPAPGFFNLEFIDVAHLFNEAYLASGTLQPFSLTFFGAKAFFPSVVQQTFTILPPPGGVPQLQRLDFSAAFQGINNAWWFQSNFGSSQAHQFTNIGVSFVPEPSTYVLMATGLVVIVGLRRRVTTR